MMAATTAMPLDKTPPDEPEEDVGSDRSMDKEVRLMGRLVRMLNEVEEPARNRVVAWLSARYFDQYKRT